MKKRISLYNMKKAGEHVAPLLKKSDMTYEELYTSRHEIEEAAFNLQVMSFATLMIVVIGGSNLKIVTANCIMVDNTKNQTLLLRVFFCLQLFYYSSLFLA